MCWCRKSPPVPEPTGQQDAESSVESEFTGGLSSPGPNIPAILATAREVAAAMTYLHHKNMLHGDLTGNNVLLTAAPSEERGFSAKVCVFVRVCGSLTRETLMRAIKRGSWVVWCVEVGACVCLSCQVSGCSFRHWKVCAAD